MAVKNISDAKPKKKKLRKVHVLWILLAVMGFMVLFGKISSNYIRLGQLDREIEAIQQDNGKAVKEHYSIDGRRIPSSQKGIHIVKYKDGSVKKVFVK